MGSFMSKKTVSMTFFTDFWAWNYFLNRELVCFHSMDYLFDSGLQLQTHVYTIFKDFLTKTYFSVHITHSFVNFRGFILLNSRIQISPDLRFHLKTYTWLEKGSIRLDVSLTAAAKTMNKMCLCARGSAQGFQALINSH